MFTILTSFKPFNGADGLRQCRAVESWQISFPDCEILAFGRSGDMERISRKYNIQLVDGIPLGDGRVPRIDSMFSYAQNIGRYDLQLYTNGDMIFGRDIVSALANMPTVPFLCVGQRWDYEVNPGKALGSEDDVLRIQKEARAHGQIHSPFGLDYFGYRKGTIQDLDPLFVGAAGWDNYMVAAALKRRMRVVDISTAVTAVHQNHDYEYVAGGRDVVTGGALALQNCKYLDAINSNHSYGTLDATHIMAGRSLRRATALCYVEQRIGRLYAKCPWIRKTRIHWRLILAYCSLRLYVATR